AAVTIPLATIGAVSPKPASSVTRVMKQQPPAITGRLTVTVSDASGKSLPGVDVFISTAFTDTELNDFQNARTDTVKAQEQAQAEQRKFELGVTTIRYLLQAQHYEAQAKAAEVELAIRLMARLSTMPPQRTEATGSVSVAGLAPGLYGVRAFSANF